MPKPVRIDDELYDKIQEMARKEHRSLTNMLNVLLKKALEGVL